MSSSAVRAGQVYVEIGADPKKFFAALGKLNKAVGAMGRSLSMSGAAISGIGAGMAAPIVAAVAAGARFEDRLLAIKASTGATQGELDRVKSAAMGMSEALGVGPTEATAGMLELLKAGMSLDAVLSGAGQAALQFAKVGDMDVATAAVVMSDAMNVFGISGNKAANTLSAAADASSTSIAQMSEAFSMSSAVAALANQSIDDLSAALAILANNGVKGSDAGTSVKTMLMRLMAPADEAIGALTQLGLSVNSFRGADGKMKPMVEIIRTLNGALAGMDQTAKDDIFRRIFGADAIRSASILTAAGTEGFANMQASMASALPVGEKYKVLMSGLSGAMGNILASLERMSIAISDAVAPALASVIPFVEGLAKSLVDLVTNNKEAVAKFATLAVATIAVGGALTGLGLSLQITSFAMGGLGKAAGVLLSPLMLVQRAALMTGGALGAAGAGVAAFGSSATASLSVAGSAALSFATTATNAMGGFAISSATVVSQFVSAGVAGFSQVTKAAAVAAQAMFPVFFTGFNRGIAAGAGFFSATLRGLNGVVMASGMLRGALLAASGSGMARFVTDIVSGLTLTYKSFVWWATGASARLMQYVASMTGAVGQTISSTAAMAAAWAGNATKGVMAFAGSAVTAIGSYLAATAMAVAGSVASAASVAAAWVAPLAPFLLLGAAIAGVAAVAYSFRDTITGAFSGLGDLVGYVSSAIGSTFSGVVSDASVVFSDLASTATTTFNGIYEAIAAGDLSGAMDILWAGLVAGWLRGTEALMSYVDPWTTAFQDVFGRIGSEVYIIWDKLYTDSAAILNTMGAWITGFFDNIANGIMATFDNLVAAIQIAWTKIQGFITGAKDTQERVQAIKDENAARAEQRRQERPGIEGRTAEASRQNADAERQRAGRERAVVEGAAADRESRQAANRQRADERRAATQDAESTLSGKTKGKKESRARNDQFARLLGDIEQASSVDQLRDLYGEFDALNSNGRLSSVQASTIEAALDDAQERVTKNLVNSQSASAQAAAQGGANAGAQDAAKSKSEVAGTFSSMALGGMGFGSSLAERTLKAAERTAAATEQIAAEGGPSAAA
jgi:TP901 family phage tail tape measure protein